MKHKITPAYKFPGHENANNQNTTDRRVRIPTTKLAKITTIAIILLPLLKFFQEREAPARDMAKAARLKNPEKAGVTHTRKRYFYAERLQSKAAEPKNNRRYRESNNTTTGAVPNRATIVNAQPV